MPLVFANGGGATREKKSGSDTWNSLKIGAEQLVSSIPALADMPMALLTGKTPATDLTEAIGEKTGLQPSRWAKENEQNYSQKYQEQRGNVDEAWQGVDSDNGLLNEAWSVIKNTPELAAAYAKNPSYTLQQVVQSLPGMVAGGVAGRGLMAVGRGAALARGAMGPEIPGVLERAVGTRWANPIASGAGEGGIAAASNFDQTDRTAPDYDPRRAAGAALATGAVDLLIGAGGGRVAHSLGLETPETLIAGGRRVPNYARNAAGEELVDQSGQAVMQGRPMWQRVLGGAAAEGGVQEFPQSVAEGGFQNLGEGRAFTDSGPDGQSILRQGVEGAMAGGLMGGGVNVIGRGRTGPTDLLTRQQYDVQNAPPPPPAAPLALPAPVMTGYQNGDVGYGGPYPPGMDSRPAASQINRDEDEARLQHSQVMANDVAAQRAAGVPGAAAMFDPARGGMQTPQDVGSAYSLLQQVAEGKYAVPVGGPDMIADQHPAIMQAVEILQAAGIKPPTGPAEAPAPEKTPTKTAAKAAERNSTKGQLQAQLDSHLQDGVISPAQHAEDTALLTDNKLGRVQTRMKKYSADIKLAAETQATVAPPQPGAKSENVSQVQGNGVQAAQAANPPVRQAVKPGDAGVQGPKPENTQAKETVPAEIKAVHTLAEQKGIKWDNDPTFMALSNAVTGERHLDKMTPSQLNKVQEYLDGLPDKNPTEPVPEDKIGDETHREAARMFDAGDSSRQIAEALGGSHTGWINTLIKYGRKHADRVAAAKAENIGTGDAATTDTPKNEIAAAESENTGSAGADLVSGDEVVDRSLEAGGVQNRASPDSGAAVVATTDKQALKEIEGKVGKFSKGRVAIVTNGLKKLGRKYTDLNPQQKLILLETGHDLTQDDLAKADKLAAALQKPRERPSDAKAKAEKEDTRRAETQKHVEDLIPKVFQGDTDARDELLAIFVNDPDGAVLYKMAAAQYTSLTGRRPAGAADFVQQIAAASQKAGTPAAPESAALTKGTTYDGNFVEVTDEEVAKAVSLLPDMTAALETIVSDPADRAKVAEHYDQETFNGPAKKAFLREYATWLKDRVWHPLEDLFKKVVKHAAAGVLAIAIAFNPTNFEFNKANAQEVPSPRAIVKQAVERPKADFKGAQASLDVRVVADWRVRTGTGRSFIVADKNTGSLFAFNAKGELLAKTPALFGKDKGDVETNPDADAGQLKAGDKITPAGVFTGKMGPSDSYGSRVAFKEGAQNVIAVHRVYLGDPKENRLSRLATATAEDNRISFGCVNVPDAFYDDVIAPNFQKNSDVIVMPEQKSLAETFPDLAEKAPASTPEGEKVAYGSDKYARPRSRKRGELFGSNARVKYKGADGKIVGSKIDPLGYQQVKVQTAAGTSDWVDANDVQRPTYGAKDAVQEPGAAGVDVQQQAGNGQGVGGRNAGGKTAEARQVEIKFSEGGKAGKGTVATVTAALNKAFFSPQRMKNLVTVHATQADAHAAHFGSADGKNVQGFVVNGQVHLIAENIKPGEELAVFLHELGVHLGMEKLVGAKNMEWLADRINDWRKKDDGSVESRIAKEAYDKALKSSTEGATQEELIAYMVEGLVAAGVNPQAAGTSEGHVWFRRLWAAVKAAFRKIGVNPEKFTPQQLVDLAYGAAQLELDGAWHGTAAEFRAFSHKFMGAGEGAQMMGWGSYLGQAPGTALQYHRQDVEKKAESSTLKTLNRHLGEKLTSAVIDPETQDEIADKGSRLSFDLVERLARAVADRAIDQIEINGKWVNVGPPAGNLMRAVANIRDHEWLDLDKPVPKEQLDKIQAGLNALADKRKDAKLKAFVKALFDDLSDTDGKSVTGAGVYRTIMGIFGAPNGGIKMNNPKYSKPTSKFLDSIGIKGNRFLDQQSRSPDFKGTPTRNLVVFNDRNLVRAMSEVGADPNRIKFSEAVHTAAERVMGKSGRQAAVDTGHILSKAVGHLMFLHDIINRMKAAVPAAKDFADAMERKAANRIQRERDADNIAVAAGKLNKEQYKSTNDFVGRSTFEQKWGYEPTWNKGVTVDPAMATEWRKLGRDERTLADAIFKHGYDTIKEKQALAILFWVEDAFTEFAQLKGPYSPLKRFGQYRAILKSQALLDAEKANDQKLIDKLKHDHTQYQVSGFDSMGQADAFAQANKGGYAKAYAFEALPKSEDRHTMAYPVLQKVMAKLNAENLPPDTKKQVLDMVNDLFVSSVEETSARMAGMRRKNRAGYDNDMVRSFLAGARADAVFMSNLIHGGDINKAFYEMERQAGDERQNQSDINLVAQHYAESMRYVPTPWQDRITGLTAAWQLATSLGYHLTNATQSIMVTLPQIAADFGDYGGAWKHVMEGYGVLKSAAAGRTVDLSKIANPGLRAALQRAADLQLMDVGMDEDLSHFERTRTGYSKIDMTTGVAASALHKLRQVSRMVELWNRVSSGTAAYNMARSHGKTDAEAQDYAIDILKSTQGDFSRTGAPLLIKKLPKPMVQYRKYQLMMAALYTKAFVQAFKGATPEEKAVGRRMLAFKLFHTSVAAGALGLPLMNLAGFLYAFGGGGDEPDWDLEKDLRDAIGDKDLADLLLHGAPAAAGFDLNAKLGDNQVFSILPYNAWDFSSKTAVAQTLGSLVGGPAVSQLGRFADGVALMGKGDTYKGVEKLLPKGLEMAMQGFRVANEGFTMKNGDVVVSPEDIGAFTTLLTTIGMPATEMRDIQRLQGLQYTTKKFFTDRSSEIEHDYARAYKEHDAEKMGDLRDDWKTLQQSKDEWRDVFNDRPDFLKKQSIGTLLKYPHTVQAREKKNARAFAPEK